MGSINNLVQVDLSLDCSISWAHRWGVQNWGGDSVLCDASSLTCMVWGGWWGRTVRGTWEPGYCWSPYAHDFISYWESDVAGMSPMSLPTSLSCLGINRPCKIPPQTTWIGTKKMCDLWAELGQILPSLEPDCMRLTPRSAGLQGTSDSEYYLGTQGWFLLLLLLSERSSGETRLCRFICFGHNQFLDQLWSFLGFTIVALLVSEPHLPQELIAIIKVGDVDVSLKYSCFFTSWTHSKTTFSGPTVCVCSHLKGLTHGLWAEVMFAMYNNIEGFIASQESPPSIMISLCPSALAAG